LYRKPLSSRQVKVLWAIALALIPVYAWIAETNARQYEGHHTLWLWAVAALGAWSAAAGHSFRRKLLVRAAAEAREAKEEVAARKWSAAQVLGLMSAQSVVLWGVIAKIALGCPRWFGAPFYVTGILLLLLWKPSK
jgi:hypothetical protein